MEFGLRRAQGPDGGVSASRAAYVGGCASTSNVLAGQRFGIPISGTHAHSWVMAFDSEIESFEAYAEAMPNNCTLLVDTYDTLQGVRNAVEVGRRLRERGHRLAAIRIDSGDLAWLSVRARAILDEGGFEDVRIIASNELDEHLIDFAQGAARGHRCLGRGHQARHGVGPAGARRRVQAVGDPSPRRGLDRADQGLRADREGDDAGAPRRAAISPEGGRLAGDMIYDIREAVPDECRHGRSDGSDAQEALHG